MPRIKSKSHAKAKTIIRKLEANRRRARRQFQHSHTQASNWLLEHDIDLSSIREHSKNLLTSGTVITSLLLSPPSSLQSLDTFSTVKQRLASLDIHSLSQTRLNLIRLFGPLTKGSPGHLDPHSQQQITNFLLDNFGIKASSNLDNHQLNHSLGIIALEQHLKRFPGDTLNQHDEETHAGIAPGLGAWGYFAHSRATLTKQDILKEKYYFAVQTLCLPDWNTNTKELSRWYKHRKMIAINPANGAMVVGVVADAGPAKWTGKHFGGSPEVMKILETRKSKILLFFVDDPDNKIPLGPVTGEAKEGITTV